MKVLPTTTKRQNTSHQTHTTIHRKFTLTLNHPSLLNKTTDVVIQQHSRRLLKMDILMSKTCWTHKKWNKIASDIKLVFHSSTWFFLCFNQTFMVRQLYSSTSHSTKWLSIIDTETYFLCTKKYVCHVCVCVIWQGDEFVWQLSLASSYLLTEHVC
jgi:hypothetical protein